MTTHISLRLCSHAGVMLPDYWSGHHLPHLSFPIRDGMSLADVKEELKSEANQGAWCGSVDHEETESEAFYNRAIEAIDGITLREDAQDGQLFDGIIEDDSEDVESPMAYFVFS